MQLICMLNTSNICEVVTSGRVGEAVICFKCERIKRASKQLSSEAAI